MKYCKNTTLEHRLCIRYKDQIKTINQIFNNEGYRSTLFDDGCVALNLDAVETERCRGNNTNKRQTVDVVIGISNLRIKQILLVELKFKMKNPANISSTEIFGKKRHSIDLLTREIQISDSYILIFADKQISQARRYATQILGRNYIVKTAKEFKETYFD